MSDELRPCPGCTQNDHEEISIRTERMGEFWWVECSCGCSGSHMATREEAIYEWQRMTRREDAQELVDALGEVLKIADDYFDDDIRLGAELIDDISPKLRSALAKWGK